LTSSFTSGFLDEPKKPPPLDFSATSGRGVELAAAMNLSFASCSDSRNMYLTMKAMLVASLKSAAHLSGGASRTYPCSSVVIAEEQSSRPFSETDESVATPLAARAEGGARDVSRAMPAWQGREFDAAAKYRTRRRAR
jgi:hypothetical protein